MTGLGLKLEICIFCPQPIIAVVVVASATAAVATVASVVGVIVGGMAYFVRPSVCVPAELPSSLSPHAAAIAATAVIFQAEHDTEARPILVTPSAALVEAVNACLRKRLWALPTRDTALEAVKKGFAVICKASNLEDEALRFFHRPVVRTCMRRPGCFPGTWSSRHLQVVSLHLKSWTSLPASQVRCFSLSVRGGRKPPVDRGALNTMIGIQRRYHGKGEKVTKLVWVRNRYQ